MEFVLLQKKHIDFWPIRSSDTGDPASLTPQETGSAMDRRYRETALGGLAADYERSLQLRPELHLETKAKGVLVTDIDKYVHMYAYIYMYICMYTDHMHIYIYIVFTYYVHTYIHLYICIHTTYAYPHTLHNMPLEHKSLVCKRHTSNQMLEVGDMSTARRRNNMFLLF